MDRNIYRADGMIRRRTGSHFSTAMAIKLLLAVCFLCQTSCTHGSYFGRQSGTDTTPTILQDIIISKDNTNITILTNKPVKYTLYNIAAPPRTVVDLDSDVLSPFKTPANTDTYLVRQIDIIKQETNAHKFTRIIFKLKRNVAFSAKTDPSSENKILLTLVKPAKIMQTVPEKKKDGTVPNVKSLHSNQPSENTDSTVRSGRDNATPPSNSKLLPPIPLTVSTQNLPQPEAKSPKLSTFTHTDDFHQNTAGKPGKSDTKNTVFGINFLQNGIELTMNGLTDENVKFFKLSKPQRLVIELFGIKNSLEKNILAVNRFGIKSIRIGTYPTKVRIVLDSSRKIFPACRIKTDNRGMQIIFNEIN